MKSPKAKPPPRKSTKSPESKREQESKTAKAAGATPAHSALRTSHPEIVLFAVTGMSPAVLTETIWALAHAKPPVIPHRVVAVTTLPGKGRIEDELFQPLPDYGGLSVWQALRRAVLGHGFESDSGLNLDEVRVIARRDPKLGRSFPLEDIRTPADNEVAADFILEELRKLTENADTQLIASLAGGRKTMGALLYAALSLLGRGQDRLTHVLVSEPFDDSGLSPRFYFPLQVEMLHQHLRTGGAHRSDAARLWLADVPFVRLRELFPKQLGRYPGTFSALVRAYSRQIDELAGPPEVLVDEERAVAIINGRELQLEGREFPFFCFLFERASQGEPLLPNHTEAEAPFKAFLTNWAARHPEFNFVRGGCDWRKAFLVDDLKKPLSSLRKKLGPCGLAHLERFLFPSRGPLGLSIKPRES